MRRYIISLVIMLGAAVCATGQNKIFWVHGLRSSEAPLWDSYKNALTAPQNQGTNISWEMDDHLQDVATELDALIKAEVPEGSKAIVFGHSAGGLISRAAAAMPGTKIRAVITAGTPNHGAGIAAAVHNNAVNDFVAKSLQRIEKSTSLSAQAWASLAPGVGGAISSLISASTSLGEKVAECLTGKLVDFLKVIFGKKNAIADMDPDNSAFLAKLNGTAPTVPLINIYSVEDSPKVVRLVGTMLHKKESDSPENTTDKCFDESLIPVYNGIINTCATFEALHRTAASTMSVLGVLRPAYKKSSALNTSAADAWGESKRYLQYDVHNDWDGIIGATHQERVENWTKVLGIKKCTVSYVTVYEGSDAFITSRSSMIDENFGPRTRNYEIKGANHVEMNSHPAMRQILKDIYAGKYGPEFNPNNK